MKIGLTYNSLPETNIRFKTDIFAEFDDISTIYAIRDAIESAGHQVVLIEADPSAYEKLKSSNLDFVFNIAEGLYGDSRESHIPAMLEMLGIPYSGSKVLSLAISLDKAKTKEILGFHKIPTPKFKLFRSVDEPLGNLNFPLFVKPNAEGSSKGITCKSLVKNERELREMVSFILKRYKQPVLVEEFLEGREFTVSLLGNPPKVLPLVEVMFDCLPPDVPRFDCYEVKWIWDSPNSGIETVKCPAEVDPALLKKIQKIAVDSFNVLGCLDFCRIDIRLDKKGIPNVLDVNPLPGLIPDPAENSRFPKSCYTAGMTYNQIILEILNSGIERAIKEGKIKEKISL